MARILLVIALIGIVVVYLWRRRRAAAVATYPSTARTNAADLLRLPGARTSILEQHVRLWHRLPAPLQERLLLRLDEFLERIPFTGAHDFIVTETMRTVIAAQACIVTLGHEHYPFDDLRGITVYPDEFVVEESAEDEDTGVVTEGSRTLSGQANGSDRLVLSWRDVEEAQLHDDGYNVVIHEVTHFLERSYPGGDPAAHAALTAAYESLCAAVDRGDETLLDPYGAEDPSEFLAVAAEFFFERPADLAVRHPMLYVLLRDSFRLDPAGWAPPPTAVGNASS